MHRIPQIRMFGAGYQYFKRIDLQKDRPHVFPLQPITVVDTGAAIH
jgi:hypothetical protein